MSFRKLKADYLFDGKTVHKNRKILICQADGKIENLVSEEDAGTEVEYFSGLLSPGFVNSHCHLELSHLKGTIPEKTGLVDFALRIIKFRNSREQAMLDAMESAEEQMHREGIVALGDICNTGQTIPLKTRSRLAYYNFVEILGWMPSQASQRFEAGRRLFEEFVRAVGDETHLSISPHAPYSVSGPLWNLISPGFVGKTITIHNQETESENALFQSGSGDFLRMFDTLGIDNTAFKAPGQSSLPYYFKKLKSAARVILVHNTYTGEEDLRACLSERPEAFFCLCPNANLYIEDRLPDIPMFIRLGARMILGTDSLASNHQLSILEEMKTIKKFHPDIPTETMLGWATREGAAALDYSDRLGDFKAGKKPGVVLIENLKRGEIGEKSRARKIL
jgi:cytosine/adenosine deaminase-related metal-dependent hydrolase